MVIVDVTVIPLGESTSVSKYVADIHKVLENSDKNIQYQLTPMSTIIEGELEDLLQVIKEIHEVPFKHGVGRVCTNLRIDDRRDVENSMERKLKSVEKRR